MKLESIFLMVILVALIKATIVYFLFSYSFKRKTKELLMITVPIALVLTTYLIFGVALKP